MIVPAVLLPHARALGLPKRHSEKAAGLDLQAAIPENEPIILAPGRRQLVPTGLCICLPDGFEGQVRSRSGLALKAGIMVLNSPGTIDSDYRGEVGVLLINLGDEEFVIRRGDRIAQLIISPIILASFELVSDLQPTDRFIGGFGSTGVSLEERGA